MAFVLFAGVVFADQLSFKFEEGNQFYQNGEYENAVAAYEEILANGFASSEVYYNLGNAYYKLGLNAKAILNYERGLALKPNDEDILFNLQIANLEVVDKIPEIPEFVLSRYLRQFRDRLGLSALTIITLCTYITFFAFLTLQVITRSHFLKRKFKAGTILISVLLVFASVLLVSKIQSINSSIQAIVMASEIGVKSAPNEDAIELFKIHEGLKVKITQQRDAWSQIKLPDGKLGWLPVNAVEII